MIIGIDTSNYTTSLAAVENGVIVSDRRRLLVVKEGERGLRQQEALFQHVNNLPELYRELVSDIGDGHVDAVSCSVRPRPVEGSYMPVFMAGRSFADVIAATLGVPLYEFSHQEGHAEAAAKGTSLEGEESYVFFHLSGGTTEAVSLPEYELCGRTLDISFGQLIDRCGVALGMKFPCGKEMDGLALSSDQSSSNGHMFTGADYLTYSKHMSITGADVDDSARQYHIDLPHVKVENGEVNLSGIESACQRLIRGEHAFDKTEFCRALFDSIADALWRMVLSIKEKTGQDRFLFAGGVSSSLYIRERLREKCEECGGKVLIEFGEPGLCRDNAVGTALLGEKLWRLNQ